MYAAQGLPAGLLWIALPAYMAGQGLSAAAIGSFIGITALPWGLKLVNGPLMDRWSFLPMGRRRPWVLGAQAGMMVSSVAMAVLPNPLEHLGWLTAFAFTINLFTALQDVAVDGMAIDIIPLSQQARASGFMWGGAALGVAGATAGGAWMISGYGLGSALLGHAFLIGLVTLMPLLLRERPGERLLPWTKGEPAEIARQLQLKGWRDIGKSLLRAFALPVSVTATISNFSYNLFKGVLSAMLPVLAVQELGWTHIAYSELKATTSLIAGIIGMVAGGLLIERFGRRRTIAVGELLLTAASVAMGLLLVSRSLRLSVPMFVSVYILVDTLINIAFVSLLMAVCSKRVAATQFSLYMALGNLGRSAGAVLLGPLRVQFEYSYLFFVVAAGAVFVLIPLCFVDLERHQQRVNVQDAAEIPRAAEPVLF
jgi:PAT family beta-lactamase induction signal transducer AmpG